MTYSKQLTSLEFSIVCAGKWLVGGGVHPPQVGGVTDPPLPWVGGTVVPGGGDGHGGGLVIRIFPDSP